MIKITTPIKMLILDVDGVLTNGSISFTSAGEQIQTFNVLDGYGIKTIQAQGIEVAIISARKTIMVERRAQELGINFVQQQTTNKLQQADIFRKAINANWNEIAYVGDDIVDLEVMKQVGYPIAVANAVQSVKDAALWTTLAKGGEGAVREACNWILE